MDAHARLIAGLGVGYLLDLAFGDPRWLPHPVVFFGHCIAVCERVGNRGRWIFGKGALCAIGLIALAYGSTWTLGNAAEKMSPWLAFAFISIGVFFFLAHRTLINEGRGVFAALQSGIEPARAQLSRIVGRDTAALSAAQIKTAVFETMAENLSDGVVAPLFFFALLGLPGMAAYKMVNTLDSMIGHHTPRYEWFGKFAARADDVANFFPARITALLMAVAACSRRSLAFAWKYGTAHASPNAGYPEAALAGILDLRFGGPLHYDAEWVEKPWIGENTREIDAAEIERVVGIHHAVALMAVVFAAFAVAVNPWLRY